MHNFRKTLKTVLIFLLVFSIMCLALMEVYFAGENSYFQDGREREAVSGTIDYAIVGASHGKRGFDTEILDEELGVCSYNYSGPVMTMWARYDLLQKEIARNPIKTVIMEVSFDSVRDWDRQYDNEGDYYYISRMLTLKERMTYFFRYFKPTEYSSALAFFLNDGIECCKRLATGKYTQHYNLAVDGDGNPTECSNKGFMTYYQGVDLTEDFDYAKSYQSQKTNTKVDEAKVAYMEMIVDLCRENDIRLILVSTPVSDKTLCKKKGMQKWMDYYTEFAQENGIEYYDFDLIKSREQGLYDATSFYDNNHLDYEGAEFFTQAFTEVMKKVDAGEDVSDLFYDSYDAYEQTKEWYQE